MKKSLRRQIIFALGLLFGGGGVAWAQGCDVPWQGDCFNNLYSLGFYNCSQTPPNSANINWYENNCNWVGPYLYQCAYDGNFLDANFGILSDSSTGNFRACGVDWACASLNDNYAGIRQRANFAYLWGAKRNSLPGCQLQVN